jgi:hypothetical protein
VNPSETLRTLTRILAAVYKAQFSLPLELTYDVSGWKMCQQVSRDGAVTDVYKHNGEPSRMFPLKVIVFTSIRATYTIVIPDESEAYETGKRLARADA